MLDAYVQCTFHGTAFCFDMIILSLIEQLFKQWIAIMVYQGSVISVLGVRCMQRVLSLPQVEGDGAGL